MDGALTNIPTDVSSDIFHGRIRERLMGVSRAPSQYEPSRELP